MPPVFTCKSALVIRCGGGGGGERERGVEANYIYVTKIKNSRKHIQHCGHGFNNNDESLSNINMMESLVV